MNVVYCVKVPHTLHTTHTHTLHTTHLRTEHTHTQTHTRHRTTSQMADLKAFTLLPYRWFDYKRQNMEYFMVKFPLNLNITYLSFVCVQVCNLSISHSMSDFIFSLTFVIMPMLWCCSMFCSSRDRTYIWSVYDVCACVWLIVCVCVCIDRLWLIVCVC